MSLTFIRARASDNKVLMRADPGYIARLNLIPGAQARRLRDGDWNARDSAGDYFDRSWCTLLERRPDRVNVTRRIRFWDKAATSPSSEYPDPDWTRGVLVALTDLGNYVVEDVQSLRAGPAEVEALIKRTAVMDGQEVEIGCWQDPGQAGKVDVDHMRRMLAGYAFKVVKATKDKATYAAVWSPHAKAGKLQFVVRDYLPEVFAEAEGFPTRNHDDFVDALSGAFQLLFAGAFTFSYDAVADTRHGSGLRDAWDERDDDDDDWAGRGGGQGAVF
jgi:predicted phage terminase large subunit-like protein